MKIYLLDRTDDLHYKWDIFDGFVIAADSEEEAIEISIKEGGHDWTIKEYITVKEIGEANSNIEKGVILDSYIAG